MKSKVRNQTLVWIAPKIMPENLKSKFVFEVFRKSGISKFQEKMDFISKLRFDTHVWNMSNNNVYRLPKEVACITFGISKC